MTDVLHVLQYALWVSTAAVQATVGILFFRRKLYRANMGFFCYTIFEVLRQTILAVLMDLYSTHSVLYSIYFYFYWASDLISIILSLAIIRAVVRDLFRQYPGLRHFSSVAFAIGVLVLLTASIVTMMLSPGAAPERLLSTILLLDRSIRIIQIGLIVLLAVIAAVLALPWKSDLSFGIAFGFGVYAALDLVAVSLRAQFGPGSNVIYAFARPISYALAVLIWFLYSRVPQTTSAANLAQAPHDAELEKWNKTLAGMLGQ